MNVVCKGGRAVVWPEENYIIKPLASILCCGVEGQAKGPLMMATVPPSS